jgi:hypothetical protein
VKPTIENGFDYRRLSWAHLPHTHESVTAAPDEDMPPEGAAASR